MKNGIFAVLSVFSFMMSNAEASKLINTPGVAITASPSTPIVIDSTLSYVDYNGQTRVVTGPWFTFKLSLDNTSVQPLTVATLHVEVTGPDAYGHAVTNKVDLNPEDFNYTGNNGLVCNYSDFGQFDPNGTANPQANSPYNNGPVYVKSVDNLACGTFMPTFYVGGNPPGTTGTPSYQVKVQAIGWFGPRNAPTTRFTSETNFTAN